MKISNLIGNALLGTCLYGAVVNSFPTNEEKDAVGEIDATNEVERAGCAAALGLKTTLGMTQGEIVAAIRGDQRRRGALASSDVEDSDLLLRRRISTAEGVAKRCLQWCASSPQETTGLDARPQWGIRGAWDDDYYQVFGTDWAFPFGTNHLAGVVVYSQGALAASSYDEPFVSLPIPVAIVPREGSFTVEQTASNSCIFAWWNVRPGRTAAETLDAQIELFRNGDYCVSTNGVVVERFIRGNPYPDVPIGQDDDYRVWVDEQVGVGLTNGLYKFTASFPDDPIEVTLLTVGEESVVVTNAGEYVFLLEKGREYEFETVPYDPTVEYWMQDDLADCPVFANWWWGYGSGVWTIGGGWNWLDYPTLLYPGYCRWMPSLQGSPDVSHIQAGDARVFVAQLSDYKYAGSVAYHWTCDDENVVIASPNSQETEISFASYPSWRSSSLRVEANVCGEDLVSELVFSYGENAEPQVHLGFGLPNAILLNSNEVNSAKLCPMTISFSSDIETNGTIRLTCLAGEDRIALWRTQDKGGSVSRSLSWRVPGFDEFTAYVEGIKTSQDLDDVSFKVEFIPDEGSSVETTRRMTVVQVNDVVLPGAPNDGLIISCGTSVALDLDVLPSGAKSLLSVIYDVRRLRGDGSYSDWAYSVGNYRGTTAVYNPSEGGIYQVRAHAGLGWGVEDERYYVWKTDENREIGVKKKGDRKAFGVVDEAWQLSLRNAAKTYLGSGLYAFDSTVEAYGGFSEIPEGCWKCNVFVAHRLVDCGFSIPSVHHGQLHIRDWPPLANEWADSSFVIPGWSIPLESDFPRPGYVVIKPSAGPNGHMGILDFDGMAISAQADLVTRRSDYSGWSGAVCRKHREE